MKKGGRRGKEKERRGERKERREGGRKEKGVGKWGWRGLQAQAMPGICALFSA